MRTISPDKLFSFAIICFRHYDYGLSEYFALSLSKSSYQFWATKFRQDRIGYFALNLLEVPTNFGLVSSDQIEHIILHSVCQKFLSFLGK